jgi:hypothetical protein
MFLTQRDKAATSFEGILNLTTARAPIADLSTPAAPASPASPMAMMARRVTPRVPRDSSGKKLTELQRAHVKQLQAIEKTLPRKTRINVAAIKTEAQAARYAAAVNALLRGPKKKAPTKKKAVAKKKVVAKKKIIAKKKAPSKRKTTAKKKGKRS